ncbi:MAG: guanylate kinase [Candidatus Omnitrophica bacterium]|nr:guanylate kinase [Candidatus Omnitrophota bacterium]MDD5690432.1 guanylate kinase [Candidatus Omnitrophota bacterium]
MKAKKRKNKTGKIFIISGPSGSGKTTLLTRLIQDKKIAKLLVKSRSVTTRPKRLGENQGKDYFFVTRSEFSRLLKAKKILEWTRYLGYYYGTPKGPVEKLLKEGRHIGLCLDLKGARILKKIYPRNAVTVFVLPPSLSVLKARIEGRCRDTNKKEIAQRLRLAQREILAASQFDYRIMNQNLRVALKELKKIFLKEKQRLTINRG